MGWIRRLIYGWHDAEIERLQRQITTLLQRQRSLMAVKVEAERLVADLSEAIR